MVDGVQAQRIGGVIAPGANLRNALGEFVSPATFVPFPAGGTSGVETLQQQLFQRIRKVAAFAAAAVGA